MLPVIAEIVRSGFVEGHHHGSVVAVAADDNVLHARGETGTTVLPRSCNKPLQALAMVRAGLDLDGDLLALAFAALATSERPEERRIATAIREHPEYVSGTTRDECALLRAVPGAIAKAGAESCYVVALADGRAFALKTDDGAPRVRPVV